METRVVEMEYRFQRQLDSQQLLINELRHEVEEGKHRMAEMLRVTTTLPQRVKELESSVSAKASETEVVRRCEELTYAVTRKADAAEIRDRLAVIRAENQGGLSSRPSREEMRDALQLCVGTDEAERMFERQIAAMASLQHKVADQVEGERDVREQALGELRNAVTDEVGAVKAELEAQVADRLRGMQRSLEEAASAHATAAAVEQKRREAASDAAAAARDQRVMQEAAAEVRRLTTTEELETHRAVQTVTATVLEQVHTLMASKASREELGQVVTVTVERVDAMHAELQRRLAQCPTHAELLDRLAAKADALELQRMGDTKAEHGDVQALIERHKTTWEGLLHRLDTSVLAEGEARRKSDQQLREVMGEELRAQREELLQRLESTAAAVRQESEGREEAVRADVRLEAANQHHQLNVRRAALKEELAHDFAALVHDEVTACVENSRLPRVERAMAGVEEAVRIERDAGGAFKREMYDAMEAKAAEHKQLLAKLRSELSGQLEHQSLRMLDESVATLEKHMTTHTADVASTRKEMVALDQKLEEAVRGEQSARQAAFDACRRDIDLHLAGVEALELKAAEVIEAGSAGLSSMRETLQDTIAKEVQRRVAGDIEGLRRRTETLRSCVDEGLQLERDARLQAVDLLREETEQMVKAHAESSSSQRSVVPFDKLKLNIQSVLKQEGTVQLLERTNAEEMRRMQTDIEAALSFMAAEAESNAVLMQQAVTDAVCTDLKGRIKKEVEKVVDKAKGSFTPALQAVCVELEDRLKQEEETRKTGLEAMEAHLDHHRAALHHELSAQYAQLTSEGKARQAALDELSQGVNERLLQASSLEGLKEEVRESLTAEARRREKALREMHTELEARLGRTEEIREELLQQTEARWTHAQAKQSALKRQCGEMMHRMRDAIGAVLQAQQRDAFLSQLRPEQHAAAARTATNNPLPPMHTRLAATPITRTEGGPPFTDYAAPGAPATPSSEAQAAVAQSRLRTWSALSLRTYRAPSTASSWDGDEPSSAHADGDGGQLSLDVKGDAAYTAGYASGVSFAAPQVKRTPRAPLQHPCV